MVSVPMPTHNFQHGRPINEKLDLLSLRFHLQQGRQSRHSAAATVARTAGRPVANQAAPTYPLKKT